jgi:hypothetical protein
MQWIDPVLHHDAQLTNGGEANFGMSFRDTDIGYTTLASRPTQAQLARPSHIHSAPAHSTSMLLSPLSYSYSYSYSYSHSHHLPRL